MQGIQNDLSVLPNLTSHDKLNIADTEAEVEAAGRRRSSRSHLHGRKAKG